MNDPTSADSRAAEALITSLERAGFTVRLEAGQLRCSPGSKLTPEQKADITRLVVPMVWLLSQWPSASAQEALDAAPFPDWPEGKSVMVREVAVVDVFGKKVCVDAEGHRRMLEMLSKKGSTR